MKDSSLHSIDINRLVIWGRSLSGEDCLNQCRKLGIDVPFFVDRAAKPGDSVSGIAVYPPEYLLSFDGALYDAVVLAMGADPSGPKKMLRDAGIAKPVFPYRQGGTLNKTLHRTFSAALAIRFDGSVEDDAYIGKISDYILNKGVSGALYGAGRLTELLLSRHPDISKNICAVVEDNVRRNGVLAGVEVVSGPPPSTNYIILATTSLLAQLRMEARLRRNGYRGEVVRIADVISQFDDLSDRALGEINNSIYPIKLPWIELDKGLDFALFDLPPRFYGMMPNGLGYVHNILEAMDIKTQTLDLDLIFYHRYHMARILDGREVVVSPSGYEMRQDPWSIDVIMDEWEKQEVLAFFEAEIEELVSAVALAKPKIIGLSLHGTNLEISREVVRRLRIAHPDVVVVVGGYDCIRPEFGANLFDDFDYMVIFEAENSLAKLVNAILDGEKVKNMPGVISKYDISALPFIPAPTVDNLDDIPFPKYPWVDVSLYRNYNGSQQTPIVLSRGCRWSRCTFCGERFSWRRRSPENVVDEIQWMVERGRNTFVFNDSDLSGDPMAVRAMCEEILRRGIFGISMSGQLRVQ